MTTANTFLPRPPLVQDRYLAQWLNQLYLLLTQAGLLQVAQVADAVDATTLSGHAVAASGIHGVTGDIVGTNDAQTLTGKTIAGGSNAISGLAHGGEVDDPSSGVHGVTGDVVGTDDTQTLSNKTHTTLTVTGAVQFGTYTATPSAVSGYITIQDSGGTTRKLGVLT